MESVFYHIGRLSEQEQLALDFSDGLSRSVAERIELGFLPMKLPVMDDQPYRIFESLEQYRDWAEKICPAGWGMGRPMIDRIIKLAEALKKQKVKYLFIGKGAAILYGYPGTTQDIGLFPQKSEENCWKLVQALKEVGFKLDQTLENAILVGKDFIQIREVLFHWTWFLRPMASIPLKKRKKIKG